MKLKGNLFNINITDKEAQEMIDILKNVIGEEKIYIPSLGMNVTFDAVDVKTRQYIINIRRSSIDESKCTYQGRKEDNTILLRIDVGKNLIHKNPNGEKIVGSHIHIYSEKYGMTYAIKIDEEDDLGRACEKFFDRFNIKEKDKIIYQKEL